MTTVIRGGNKAATTAPGAPISVTGASTTLLPAGTVAAAFTLSRSDASTATDVWVSYGTAAISGRGIRLPGGGILSEKKYTGGRGVFAISASGAAVNVAVNVTPL